MTLTGIAFATVEDFWPLLLVAFVGTLNPSSGDVSVFLPLEQAQLARLVSDRDRTRLFARATALLDRSWPRWARLALPYPRRP